MSKTELAVEIDQGGYYPQFVAECLARSVAGEKVLAQLVHNEATFNHEAVGRHLTVLVLTPTRLLVAHTDEGTMPGEEPQAITTTESIPLRKISTAAVSQLVSNPAEFDHANTDEAWLAVSWGALQRIDLEPAGCGDPNCEADHGLTGGSASDDLTIRMSTRADTLEKVDELLDFAAKLQLALGRL
ncbi:MAG: DUF5998 family protein [Propionibacteriaceae bacterium]|nr:DUF5998 family protein [Propionibacteriaceae bacterium]